jgi:hypothetical protein
LGIGILIPIGDVILYMSAEFRLIMAAMCEKKRLGMISGMISKTRKKSGLLFLNCDQNHTERGPLAQLKQE